MRTLLFSVVLTLILWSCTKRDNSSLNIPCTDSCTTIRGRFLTGNNEPIAGITLEVRSESRPSLGLGLTTIRKIATGKTDANGSYSFTFSLKPGEYGNTNKYLFLKFDYDKTRFLPIPWYEQFGTDEIVPVRGRKDTTVIMDYFLAGRAQLNLQLNNFIPVTTADSFYVSRVYHDVGYNKTQVTETQFLVATQVTNEKTMQAAGNQQNRLIVVRKKNGVRLVSDTLIFTPTNQTTTLTLSY